MRQEIFIRAVWIENGKTAVPASLLNGLRRADDFIRMAVLAGAGALIPGIATENGMGIFLGTTTGPLDTSFRFLDTLFDNGEGQGSPTLFTHSVHNSAAGYLSRLLEINGPVLTITTPGWPFLAALAEAKAALESSEIETALVLGVEEECPVLSDARERLQAGTTKEKPRAASSLGAVAWLLARADDGSTAAPRLREIIVEENPCDPAFYLQRQEENLSPVIAEEAPNRAPRSLTAPLFLSRALQESSRRQEKSLSWTVTAPCGRASVRIEF
jgi:hypothetical protein